MNTLKIIQAEDNPLEAIKPVLRKDLLTTCDKLIVDLKWDNQMAKDFLSAKMNTKTRQNLSDNQLIKFNKMLLNELKWKSYTDFQN